MKSLWNEAEARAAVAHYGAAGVGEDLALRTYSARLLGADPALVLHGGGNTSVKTRARDLYGDEVEVLCVKGSGWDLATIEPPGHPAVRLAGLLRLRSLERLSDEDMVGVQRQNLLDSAAPNPSVETLLHAFIGEKFIDHTHSTAVLALADQPDAEAIVQEVWGGRVACVPYVMPGFELAKAAADAWDAHPGIEGLVLLKHGIFAFGATARESYERMIALVSSAEARIAAAPSRTRPASQPSMPPAEALPRLRGALQRADGRGWVLDTRGGEAVRALCDMANIEDLAARGVATPDHVIRTKARPLVLPPWRGEPSAWDTEVGARLAAYAREYQAYFERNVGRFPGGKTPLDASPRVALAPGLGLIGIGASSGEASIAADIAQSWAQTLMAAEAVGRFAPVGEADTFDLEYWSLEQAKLGKAAEKRLQRRIVAITGGAGAIGAATAHAFASEGAEIAVLDLDEDAARRTAQSISRRALGLACDVTDGRSVRAALEAVCARFGGLDIVVLNAGAAIGGDIAVLPEAELRRAFEVNLFGQQNVAQAAVEILRRQGVGGCLLFNVSKQALNPGPGFGAYGASKAALLALMRQYALEHGRHGIRVNALNPDRIRSGLLTPRTIAERAAARGVDEAAYMSGNLLGEEVTAQDVADAFVLTALMRRTTGAVITVDGGNVAAMVR
ncbi:MAG TPA: bifunctional aldolase/short-chain dehydrogenase [Caulobacteraceae bacterium]|jgi:rhamnose utilization protein RhaD (predicted bifunctional aldolase and dehydrogenase)/NAD(P)-dependent dehydrogenase (short-subunit alcohol dehydrogenase family)|nr:bifunctional aldolase/short-chain dehydrogenase [Caulobacteraceae bacterium]